MLLTIRLMMLVIPMTTIMIRMVTDHHLTVIRELFDFDHDLPSVVYHK